MIDQAIAMYKQGRLGEAEGLLSQLLRQSPNHFDALHLSGVIARQTKRSELAVDLISRAIRQNARVPAAYRHRANALLDLRRPQEAVEDFDQAVRLKPDFVEAYIGRGFTLLDLGRAEAALASFDRAILLRGATLAAPHYGRAAALLALRRAQEALESSEHALKLQPDVIEGLLNRAAALLLLKRSTEALASCVRVLNLEPGSARALAIQGAALSDLGRYAEALRSYDRSIELQHEDATAHSGRGSVLLDLQRPEEARRCFERAIELQPKFAVAHNNLGVTLGQLGQFAAARSCFEQALTFDPAADEFRLNAGMLHLQHGEFVPGWKLYESRPRQGLAARKLRSREWSGELPIAGRTLLLLAEQGFGDAMQFCRYVPCLERLGARVVLWAPAKLLTLLQTVSASLICIADNEPEPVADFHCRLLSVPYLLRKQLPGIPAQVPYLSVAAERVAYWQQRLGTEGFKIGIGWQGAISRMDLGRSYPLTALRPLATLPGVRLVSLQKGEGLEQLTRLPADMQVEVPQAPFDDGPDAFLDTGALMQCLDLIVTSDTSLAHLGGALGRPTWVALQYVPDWRWQLQREDSPWYAHMRLFRQTRRGDWDTVIDRIYASVVTLLAAQIARTGTGL